MHSACGRLSHALRACQLPQRGSREGAGTIQRAARKPGAGGRFSSPMRKRRESDIVPRIEVKKCPHSRQEKPIDKTLYTCYNTWELTEQFSISHRGVEQLEARRAHNPEVVGSSPASATKIIPDFDMKSGIFLTFYANSHWLQICFGDSLGIAQNLGWETPNFFIENGFSVNSAIFSPQTPPPGHPRLSLWR